MAIGRTRAHPSVVRIFYPRSQLTGYSLGFYSGFEAMLDRTFTIPNQVSLLRLVFVPFFTMLVLEERFDLALALAVLAAASDFVDGWVARRFKQRSALGAALDPMADKVLMGAAYIVLSCSGLLPWWLTALVLIRDGGILGGAVLVIFVGGYRPLLPTATGKASTCGQLAAVLAAVGCKAQVPFITPLLVQICVYLAGALTIISGLHYLAVSRQRLVSRPGKQLL
ncbi:MAG: CDP-alcohol phosphatidyltransferase family protein [Terriglobia bacterium]